MPRASKLLPMDVAARVVDVPTTVPLLQDAPFAATGVLEPGVHVHWALPDVLTYATTSEDHPPWFRGVPDLWLVVRFNPVRDDPTRTYQAWVVDSVEARATPLAEWQSPPDRPAELIHTAPGMLHRAANGWGQWDAAEPFDALTTAYYPSCRARLGFHDDLADLGGPGAAAGTISYTVIGWYSQLIFDPLYSDRISRLLRIGQRPHLAKFASVSAKVSTEAALQHSDWLPEVSMSPVDLTDAQVRALRSTSEQAQFAIKSGRRNLSRLIEAIGLDPDSPQHAVVESIVPDATRTETVCHGSVMDVPLRDSQLIGFDSLGDDDIHLYPNLQRALAEVAAQPGMTVETDHLDMMLGALGQQAGSTQGVVDLPGAQHARTFQSVPGTSTFYARLDIRPVPGDPVTRLTNEAHGEGAAEESSGHWPPQEHAPRGSAGGIPPAKLNTPPAQVEIPEGDIIDWITELRAAFADAQQVAAAAGKALDPRLIRVQDHRDNAQPTAMGRTIDGTGPGQAGWWLDLDPDAPIDIVGNPAHRQLAELRRSVGGSQIHMPDGDHVFEVPGPRWYRPWAPHLVVYRAHRSFRHGMDGRFRADGHLATRVSGESMVALKVGGTTVLAKDLISPDGALAQAGSAGAGLPSVASGLVSEHLLADTENAAIMARVARIGEGPQPNPEEYSAAARAVWLGRAGLSHHILDDEHRDAISNVVPVGTPSSAVGLQAWRDWYGPLFLDSAYTHRRKRFDDAWELPPEHIETVDRIPEVPPDRSQVITERQVATVTIAKVLKKSLLTDFTIDAFGKPVRKQPPPDGLTEDMFDQIDIVSASLTHLDDELFTAGEHEQGGFVHLNRITIFDTFGTPAGWGSEDAILHPLPPWAVALPARLSTWGRLNFRLQSAADATAEATPLTPPVCGILLPDFVDQSLEVYDADGSAVGQVQADDAYRGKEGQPDRNLGVTFTPLPWVGAGLTPGQDPTSVITNPTLRRLVLALVASGLPADGPVGPDRWHETGFTAMMRVFDTVRSTLDPSFRPDDARVRLLGDPVIVMNARLRFEASAASVGDLRTGPATVADTEALPTLRVRLGDVTRPDDGVLGCFIHGASPAEDRFAPVSPEAISDAAINTLVHGAGSATQAITHPFVAGQVSEFDLAANEDLDTVIIADARGSLYATCGMLPRKSITMPRDFIEPAEKALEPTFRVGPILGFERQGLLTPIMPAPEIEGMDVVFVHDDETTYPELALPPQLPIGELPAQRVRLTEGWARMHAGR